MIVWMEERIGWKEGEHLAVNVGGLGAGLEGREGGEWSGECRVEWRGRGGDEFAYGRMYA